MSTRKSDLNYENLNGLNFEELALTVLGHGVKAEGANYLLSRDGRMWSELLGVTDFSLKQLSEYFIYGSYGEDEMNYRIQRPKICPTCMSQKISLEFEEDDEIRDSYWKCQCGWEDARSTVYLQSQREAA